MKNILTGHSSFYLRTGWIKKGIEYVKFDNKENIFSKSNIGAIDFLGIGSVMVQSLKFWLELLDIIEKKDKEYFPKRYIEEILEHDPYLENKNILWLLHIYIMERDSKEEKAVLWNLLLENKKINAFTEENARKILEIYLKENNLGVSERTIKDSIGVFIKTYFNEKDNNLDPEDNLFSPFIKLNYLLRNEEGIYYFRNIDGKELSEYIILYLLCRHTNFYEKKSITINELYEYVNGIIRMRFLEFTKLLNKLEERGIISLDRAGGLNNIKIVKEIEEKMIFKRILESEK
ncbi:DUF4007 family protein [Cetobacterium sp. SF1]|uniref:DUF4007 family protein n=1 Tax=Cetobacterium sp. SF1 TaxID=3417654 RepID=UPI003CF7FFD1